MEYEVREKENHKIQSLGKLKTTKSQGIEIKTGKNKMGTGTKCSRTKLAQGKSFDYIREQDYREFTTCHPSSYPLMMII